MYAENLLDLAGFAFVRGDNGIMCIGGKSFSCGSGNGNDFMELLESLKEGEIIFITVPTNYCSIRDKILAKAAEKKE